MVQIALVVAEEGEGSEVEAEVDVAEAMWQGLRMTKARRSQGKGRMLAKARGRITIGVIRERRRWVAVVFLGEDSVIPAYACSDGHTIVLAQ